MARQLWALGVALAVGTAAGCGGSSDTEDASGTGGGGGADPSGEAGGTATGGSLTESGGADTGGSAPGGSGGELAGGSAGDATGGGGDDTGGSSGGSGGDATGGRAGEPTGGRAGHSTGGSAGSAAGGRAGGPTGGGAGEPTGEDGGIGGEGGSGVSATGGAGGQVGADCDTLSRAISEETSGVHACTAVVRLDYETRTILGFQLLCAPYAQVDEATARQTASDDTGYGLGGSTLSGEAPEDEYVFYESPGDFGGAGVVSVRSGITVFGGSIIWSGTGEITYPTTWRPASAIGPGCVPLVNALPPTARGIDLSGGQGVMDQSHVDAAMNQVWATALPDGMWRNQYVFDAMVLLYPRSVGMMNPATAEWIVLINFGWLE